MVINYSGTKKTEDLHKTNLNDIVNSNVLYICIKTLKQSLRVMFTKTLKKTIKS